MRSMKKFNTSNKRKKIKRSINEYKQEFAPSPFATKMKIWFFRWKNIVSHFNWITFEELKNRPIKSVRFNDRSSKNQQRIALYSVLYLRLFNQHQNQWSNPIQDSFRKNSKDLMMKNSSIVLHILLRWTSAEFQWWDQDIDGGKFEFSTIDRLL